MAHKLAVMTFAQGCAKIVSQVTIESREWARSAILDEIKDVVVDDSHDIGATSFTLADTKGRDSARLSRTHADACDFFELDVASEKGFGFCKCGFAKARHSAAAIAAGAAAPCPPAVKRAPAPAPAAPPAAPEPEPEPEPEPAPAPAPKPARRKSVSEMLEEKRAAKLAALGANPTAYALACVDEAPDPCLLYTSPSPRDRG